MNRLESTLKKGLQAIAAVKNIKKLDDIEQMLFGRKSGEFTALLKSIKSLPDAEKRTRGAEIQAANITLSKAFEEKKKELGAAHAITLDWSEPSFDVGPRGTLHPITHVQWKLEDFFVRMGFSVFDGPELETDYYNFESLNFPVDHPARESQDSFYIAGLPGRLMRTHTSSMQVRALRKYGSPLNAIVPGRCFRNEATDARHEHTFHQLEGFMVGADISFAHLKGLLEATAHELYGPKTSVRLRPKYYPFVEPGVNGEVSCSFCDANGCALCKQTGYLEIFGAGLIHPNVLNAAGLDPEKVSGLAFGLGLTRLAMLLYSINDIRLFHQSDMDFLEQF